MTLPIDMREPRSPREHIFRRALECCTTGRLPEARTALEKLLARHPNDAQALLLLGSILAESDPDVAAQLLTRCVAVAPDESFALHNLGKLRQRYDDHRLASAYFSQAAAINPNFAPTFNDLGCSFHRLGEHERAMDAFDRAIALDPTYLTAQLNRALVLLDLRRTEDAHRALSRIVDTTPTSGGDWNNVAVAHHRLGNYAAAIEACHTALARDGTSLAPYDTLALALERLHRDEEASDVRTEWARREGVIVKPCLGERRLARILLIGAADLCNVPTHCLIDRSRFETVAVNLRRDGGPSDAEIDRAARDCDVVFNVVGDEDRGMPYLERASTVCQRLARPVLNPPECIRSTRRDLLAERLNDIADLMVPATRRVGRAALAMVAEQALLRGPILLRPVGTHGGDDLVRIDAARQIVDYCEASPAAEYYLTEYYDYRSEDGQFRKYRVIFVDRCVFPYHLAIGPNWMLHYWRVDMSKEMRDEEEAFLADYRSVFRGTAGDALMQVAERMALDYAGMDCTLLPDGRVLMFEANATMLVHLAEPRDTFAYKHQYVPPIIDAMTRLITKRMHPSRPTME